MAAKKKSNTDDGGSFLNEIEKTGNAIIDEVKQLFESLTSKVGKIAGSAADATVSMAEKVGSEPAEALKTVVKDVREAGEASIQTIGEKFDGLRDYVSKSETGAAADTQQEPAKKASAKKKASNKAAVKKKASAKKKATTKKKSAAKKKVAGKQATAKKTSKKKAGAKKKTVSRKKAAVTSA